MFIKADLHIPNNSIRNNSTPNNSIRNSSIRNNNILNQITTNIPQPKPNPSRPAL